MEIGQTRFSENKDLGSVLESYMLIIQHQQSSVSGGLYIVSL